MFGLKYSESLCRVLVSFTGTLILKSDSDAESYFRQCKCECDAHLSESAWTGTSVKMEADLCVLY